MVGGLVIHDVLLRVDGRRGGNGSAKKGGSHAGMAARFEAWRGGRRLELVRWWKEARARAWADADGDRIRLGDSRTSARRYADKVERAQHLLGEGEISRAISQALSEGAADSSHRGDDAEEAVRKQCLQVWFKLICA